MSAAREAKEQPAAAAEDAADDVMAGLAAAISVRGAVHSSGLIGGIGLKVVDAELLYLDADEPDWLERLAALVMEQVRQALGQEGIVYGLLDEEIQGAVDEFVEQIGQGEVAAVTRKVAEGEAPEAGVDGWIEYPLNPRGRPFHELFSLRADSSRKHCTVVRGEDVLAVLHPPTPPRAGTDVRGESLSSATGLSPRSPSLQEVAGNNILIEGEKLLTGCDGICEEDARGHLRVIPEIVVPRVDESTGRIPESGIIEASVVVVEDIRGQGVATAETLFVGTGESGGTIDRWAPIQGRNLVLYGQLIGESEGRSTPVEVEEICAVGEVMNRSIVARQILVTRDSHGARLDGETDIRVEEDLRGGVVVCRGLLQVGGDLGTRSGGSGTRIVLPAEPIGQRRKKKLIAEIKQYRDQLKTMRTGQEKLEKQAEKRAQGDPYWTKLMEGERHPPQGPLQVKALQQFAEYLEQKQQAERRLKGVKQALALVVAEQQKIEKSAQHGESTVVVGGTLHLDTVFEMSREMTAEDGDLAVSFTHETNEFVRSKLSRAATLLRQQVGEYREQQEGWIGEKQKAIDQMFKGREKKPTVPQMEDRLFELPFTWLEGDEPEELEIKSVLLMRAREPQKLMVKSTARIREPRENVIVRLRAEGARGTFSIQPNVSPLCRWTEDQTLQDTLKGIVVGGLSALDVLCRDDTP